jgi:hypothetical protein
MSQFVTKDIRFRHVVGGREVGRSGGGFRRGSMLLETAVACVLLVALAGVCLKSFAVTARQRLAIDQRQIALRAAENLMEKLSSIPLNELDKGIDTEPVYKKLAEELDDPDIQIETTTFKDSPDARRVSVAIVWHDKNDQPLQPVRLTAWRFHR